MNKCCWRLMLVAGTALTLAGCGSKETKEALKKATDLENQKQYQEANTVLVEALRAREAQLRPAAADAPTDAAGIDALTKRVEADPEILKMERAQIPLYLHLERADLASAVYADILGGSPNDSVVYNALADKDPLIRAGAVRVLGLAGKKDCIPALAKATKDEDKEVRRAAVAALGTIIDPASVDPLIGALKDSYWFARSEAASALGHQLDPRAVKPLLDAVGDSDDSVEGAVENALLLICQAPKISADDFANRLNDPNPKVVSISAICLAVLKDSRAVPVLLKLVVSTNPLTRLQAVKGLGESGDPSVIPYLRETLKDQDVNMRGWSIIGLGNLKDQDSLPALQALASDPTQPPKIQGAATAAIQHITGQQSSGSQPASPQ